MKKIYNCFFLILITFTFFFSSGCDVLEKFFLNLPIKEGITATGTSTTIAESDTVYLRDYDAYSDNIDKIISIKYLDALYRTLPRGENPSPPPDSLNLTPGLVGNNIQVTVTDGDGNLLFTRSLPSVAAEDYLTEPYMISLEGSEITLMNNYLEKIKDETERDNISFIGTITMSGIPAPPPGSVNVLTGQIELLYELEMEP